MMRKDEMGLSEKVKNLVDHLGHELDPSILIGGWATQLRVGGEISYDVDLIINSPNLRNKLREILTDYSENTHLGGGKKIRGTVDEVHVDAYLPHESQLGQKLRLNVAVLAEYVDPNIVKGWYLLTLEAHLVTKFAALVDRPDSEKGSKDAREVLALITSNVDAGKTIEVLIRASELEPTEIPAQIELIFSLIPDRVRANKDLRKLLHNLRRQWVDEAERQVRRLENPVN